MLTSLVAAAGRKPARMCSAGDGRIPVIDDHLQAKMKQLSYADLTEGLDDIEDVTNERMKQQDMMWRMPSQTPTTMASGWGITIYFSDWR